MGQRDNLLWSDAPPHLLEAVFHSSTTAGIVVDCHNNICLVNDAALKMTGYTSAEAIGRDAAFLVPEHQKKDAFYAILNRLESGQNFGPFETVLLHKDGTPVPVAIFYYGARNEEGKLIGVVKAARPLAFTDHEGRFRLVFEAAPNGMLMVDRDGRIVMINSRVESLFGYTREELIGRELAFIAPKRFHAATQKIEGEFVELPWTDAMSKGIDLFALKKDGSELPIEIGINPIDLDSGSLVLLSVLDLTERKRNEDLIEARDRAINLSQMKTAFVANISHELRTPLSGILGMNELLLGMELSAEQLEIAEAIRDSSQALLRIVNDVLDIAKIEAGKVALSSEKLSISDVVHQSLRVVNEAAKAKNIKLVSTVDQCLPAYLIGDPERIKQILINLLGNAVKFTSQGQVSLEATCEQDDDKTISVRFTVRDTGAGMDGEKLKALFRPFSQVAETYTGRSIGTGLGLSICKSLVEAMDGRIGVDSVKGSGSVFWFVIPLRRWDRNALQSASGQYINADINAISGSVGGDGLSYSDTTAGAASATAVERSVLLVEDSPLLRVLAIKQLEKLGVKSQIVGSGLEAVELIKTRIFDLIFMDINIPDLDGLETTKRIRAYEKALGRHTPIIAMTAAAMKGDLERCMEAGMDDYLRKPVSMDDLREKLDAWLPGLV